MTAAISINHLSHRYGERVAISDLSLDITKGELFGLLGPNGSGKTTLFRILSTLIPIAKPGRVIILGHDLATHREQVRRELGVVFQAPSLDRHLTAIENLRYHGHLYGLFGKSLSRRIDESLAAAGLNDRANERVESFSGGMRRRVELAKGLLTRPKLLLLDEPSTGLDPAARIDLWTTIEGCRTELGVTVVLTTHLMDEADRCDRLAIVSRGKLLACDAPQALKARYTGGEIVKIKSSRLDDVRAALKDVFSIEAQIVDDSLRFERPDAASFIASLFERLPGHLIEEISVARPSLQDVFVRLTGHKFLSHSDQAHELIT